MTLIIISFFIILFILIKYLKIDSITRFIAYIFLLIWFLALSLASLSPFDFYEINPMTFIILMTGVLSFIFGLCLSHSNSSSNSSYINQTAINTSKFDLNVTLILNSRLLSLVLLIIGIYQIKFVVASLAFAAMYNAAATSDLIDTKFVGDKFGLLLNMYLVGPLINCLIVLYIYAIIRKLTIKKLSILIFLYFFSLYCIINGGRGIFVTIASYYLIVYVFTYGSINYKKYLTIKNVFISCIVGIILFICMSVMTAYRLNGSFELDAESFTECSKVLAETPSRYAIVPIELFNYSLENNYIDKFGGYKYGRMTFAGFDLIITGILRKIGLDISSTDSVIEYLQDNWILCSNTSRYNYAYTGFFYSYLDLGVFGVIIFPFILGFCYRYLICIYLKKPTVPLLCVNCFIFIMMYNSFFTNKLHNSWAVFYIIILLLWNCIIQFRIKSRSHIDN